jgi:hypothetical protein
MLARSGAERRPDQRPSERASMSRYRKAAAPPPPSGPHYRTGRAPRLARYAPVRGRRRRTPGWSGCRRCRASVRVESGSSDGERAGAISRPAGRSARVTAGLRANLQ